MGRTRYIKPEFFNDEEIAELPMVTRLGFIGLWCHADREGRLEDRPKRLRGLIFPHDKQLDFVEILDALAAGGFIIRYQVSGKSYIQIRSFAKHQHPHHKEKPSEIPACPEKVGASTYLGECQPVLEWGMGNGERSSAPAGDSASQEKKNGQPKTNGHSVSDLSLGEELQHAKEELTKTKALVAELRAAAATTTALATVAQVQAAAVVSESGDIVKDLFDLGVRIMTKTGTKEGQARSIVGTLRKNHGDSEAMRILIESESKTHPQSWLAATFSQKAYTPC